MNFTLESTCVLELEHKPGKETSNHVSTKFNLEVSENLDQKHYLKNDGMPTKDGTTPSKGAIIEVYPKARKVDYLIVAGTEPKSGIREFTKDLEMAEALTLVK